MRLIRPAAALVLIVMPLANPTRVGAQDVGDAAAYVALNLTPMGGLVPLPPPVSSVRGSTFLLRYATIDFGLSSLNHFTAGANVGAGPGQLGLTLGLTTCGEECDGSIHAGVDYTIPLTRNVLSVALRPAMGFAKIREDDVTAFSFGASLPLGFELSEATGPIFVPYLAPGLGFGRMSGDESSESGMRPTLGGGLAVTGRRGTFGLHLGFNKVFIDEGDTAYGFGVSFGRRSAP